MKPVTEIYPQINYALWAPLLFGASWFNGGQCYEYGVDIVTENPAEFHEGLHTRINLNNLQSEIICSLRYDGTRVKYDLIDQVGMVCWEGREYLPNQTTSRIKHYDCSRWFNQRILSYDVGESYESYDICPLLHFCVGHAYYDDSSEFEIFFMCTEGVKLLDQVAAYYQLPIPYGPQHLQILNTDPKLYRAGHYDLFKAGPGMFIPLVLASIVFIDNRPSRLLFHTFQRPWEFSDSLDIDYF